MRVFFFRKLFQVKILRLITNQKWKLALLVCLGFFSVVLMLLLLQWNIICLNMDIEIHLNRLCQDYHQGKAFGSLCQPLCDKNQISVLSCQSMHKGKVAVFTAQWNNSVVVIKSHRVKSEYIPLQWTNNASEVFPNYDELVEMISQSLRLNFGVQQTSIVQTLFPFLDQNSKELTHYQMINLWQLAQDNEYVMLMMNQRSKIFPQIISTCGTFYAVEYADPVFSTLNIHSSQLTDWRRRITYSKLILELIEGLSNSFPDPIHICDVKLEHFGLINDKMVVLDADTVFPKSVVDRSTADGRPCNHHQDCDLFDCRSLCNQVIRRCDTPVVNNNLQLICQKIFLDAGLLSSNLLPASKRQLIESCADPYSSNGRQAAPFNAQLELMSFFIEYLELADQIAS